MARQPRSLPSGYSFHITLRCNSRQFLIAKGLRRDVLLAVLDKAKKQVPHKLYAVCLMANHLHLLVRPDDASELPKLMHWFGWYSAMALNRLSGRCGHFWEARYYSTAIAPKDHRRVLNTLRYIHANPWSWEDSRAMSWRSNFPALNPAVAQQAETLLGGPLSLALQFSTLWGHRRPWRACGD